MLGFEHELVYGGLAGTELSVPTVGVGRAKMSYCQVGFRSYTLKTLSIGVRIIVIFPQHGLGLQTGWEQAASTLQLFFEYHDCALNNSVSPLAAHY